MSCARTFTLLWFSVKLFWFLNTQKLYLRTIGQQLRWGHHLQPVYLQQTPYFQALLLIMGLLQSKLYLTCQHHGNQPHPKHICTGLGAANTQEFSSSSAPTEDSNTDNTQRDPSSFLDLVPTIGPNSGNRQSKSSPALSRKHWWSDWRSGICFNQNVSWFLVVLLWRKTRKKYVLNPFGNVMNNPAYSGKSVNTVCYFGIYVSHLPCSLHLVLNGKLIN